VKEKWSVTSIPIVYITIGAIIISFSGVWVKVARVPPTTSAFYRVFFGGVFLLAAVLWKRELSWKGAKYFLLAGLCGFFFALDLYCWHQSIHYIGPGLATILSNFEVFLLAIVGFTFLGEGLGWRFILSVPLVLAGLYLIVGLEWETMPQLNKTGIYFGLATAAGYSAYILALRRLQSVRKTKSIFYSLMMVSWITAFFLALELFRTDGSFAIPDGQSWWALISLGLLSQAVGWIFIANALPRIKASLAGLILLLQPSLAFVWDVMFFNRPTQPVNWIGVAMALAAIYLGATHTSRSGS
jgi:drug/metabolite transporter (DMT)-like permease